MAILSRWNTTATARTQYSSVMLFALFDQKQNLMKVEEDNISRVLDIPVLPIHLPCWIKYLAYPFYTFQQYIYLPCWIKTKTLWRWKTTASAVRRSASEQTISQLLTTKLILTTTLKFRKQLAGKPLQHVVLCNLICSYMQEGKITLLSSRPKDLVLCLCKLSGTWHCTPQKCMKDQVA